jgi:transposase
MTARPEILGAERRRKWSPMEKARFLEEALQPGVTVASVADKHGISRGLLYHWMAKARSGLLAGVTPNGGPTPRFIPVRVAQDAAPPCDLPAPALPPPARTSLIEIVLGNGRVLKVRESIDPSVLGRLAEALDKSGS